MGFPISQYDYIKHWHEQLFSRFEYVSDQTQFQIPEFWIDEAQLQQQLVTRTIRGDCEEFARACMAKYRQIGLKTRLVLCTTETGEGHCVCEVASADGTEAYIADNRRKSITTSDKLQGYTFIAVSPWNPEPGETRPWALVKSA